MFLHFDMQVQHKLQQKFFIFCAILGALTKGDRRAATGADLTEFNFDTPYGRQALRTMYHHISHVSFGYICWICYHLSHVKLIYA